MQQLGEMKKGQMLIKPEYAKILNRMGQNFELKAIGQAQKFDESRKETSLLIEKSSVQATITLPQRTPLRLYWQEMTMTPL